MTIDNAKLASEYLKFIDSLENLDNRIRKLHRENDTEQLANIALELKSELIKEYKNKIATL